jgi:hypothetical protein
VLTKERKKKKGDIKTNVTKLGMILQNPLLEKLSFLPFSENNIQTKHKERDRHIFKRRKMEKIKRMRGSKS